MGQPAPVSRRWWVVLALCVGTSWQAVRPGSVTLADRFWTQAHEAKGDDYRRRVYVEVAGWQRDVAPWQGAWPRARHRLEVIGQGRRAALPHDRGGWRQPVRPVDE